MDRAELVDAYLRLAGSQDIVVQQRCIRFMEPYLKSLLSSQASKLQQEAIELSNSIRVANFRQVKAIFSLEVMNLAFDILRNPNYFEGVSVGQRRLAYEVVRSHSSSARLLTPILDTMLVALRRIPDKQRRLETETLAVSVAEEISAKDIVSLLRYPLDSPVVGNVLRNQALERGLLVFDTWISDADGNRMSVGDAASKLELDHLQSAEILASLPGAQYKALMSYVLVLQHSEECTASSSYQAIHAVLEKAAREELPGDMAEQILQPYENADSDATTAVPSFDTWRQNLNRAIGTVSKMPMGIAFLQKIGLPRRL